MFLTGDPECTLDESKNVEGPNRCSMDTECAGARDCSEWGWCEGDSGCESGDACNYDESKNPLGPNRCVKKE